MWYGGYIEKNTGKLIDVKSYDQCVVDFASSLDDFAQNPENLLQMALALREDSFNYTSERREEFYKNIYESTWKENIL